MDGAAESHAAKAVESTPHQQGAGNQTRAGVQGSLVEEAERVATTLSGKLPMLSGDAQQASGNSHNATTDAAREPQAHEPQAHDVVEEAAFGTHASPQPSAREEMDASALEETAARSAAAQGDSRGRVRQRAAAVGASVGENLRPRVEKLREASTVVFDEATDDPGLRFLLVATVLFLLFLFILLFSYILG